MTVEGAFSRGGGESKGAYPFLLYPLENEEPQGCASRHYLESLQISA